MAIVLTRIDNRLLHGVVATQWAPSTGCTRLMVIDNEVADDPQKKETMNFCFPHKCTSFFSFCKNRF